MDNYFKIDRDFKVEKQKIESKVNISDAERLRRLRQSKKSNPQNRFIIDKSNHMIHDRSCQNAKKISDVDFDMVGDFDTQYKLCKQCKFNLLLRSCGVVDGNIDETKKLLRTIGADATKLYDFVMGNDVKIKYLHFQCIELTVNNDTWRIHRLEGQNLYELLHNNYAVVDKQRVFEERFHPQTVYGRANFTNFAQVMSKYTWKYHKNKIEQHENEEIALAPVNEWVLDVDERKETFTKPTAVRLKHFSLIFDYYYLIDAKCGFAEEIFQKRKIRMKVLEIGEKDNLDYRVVYMRVPKWHRRKIFSAANKLRSKMYKADYDLGYICCKALMRVLEQRKIRFYTKL